MTFRQEKIYVFRWDFLKVHLLIEEKRFDVVLKRFQQFKLPKNRNSSLCQKFVPPVLTLIKITTTCNLASFEPAFKHLNSIPHLGGVSGDCLPVSNVSIFYARTIVFPSNILEMICFSFLIRFPVVKIFRYSKHTQFEAFLFLFQIAYHCNA